MAVVGDLDLVLAHDADGVRQLLAQVEEELLADELRHELLVGGVGVHALGEPPGALGQVGGHEVDEAVDVEALGGRGDDDIVEVAQLARGLELGLHLLGT